MENVANLSSKFHTINLKIPGFDKFTIQNILSKRKYNHVHELNVQLKNLQSKTFVRDPPILDTIMVSNYAFVKDEIYYFVNYNISRFENFWILFRHDLIEKKTFVYDTVVDPIRNGNSFQIVGNCYNSIDDDDDVKILHCFGRKVGKEISIIRYDIKSRKITVMKIPTEPMVLFLNANVPSEGGKYLLKIGRPNSKLQEVILVDTHLSKIVNIMQPIDKEILYTIYDKHHFLLAAQITPNVVNVAKFSFLDGSIVETFDLKLPNGGVLRNFFHVNSNSYFYDIDGKFYNLKGTGIDDIESEGYQVVNCGKKGLILIQKPQLIKQERLNLRNIFTLK